jgi:Na+/phosphate symporter
VSAPSSDSDKEAARRRGQDWYRNLTPEQKRARQLRQNQEKMREVQRRYRERHREQLRQRDRERYWTIEQLTLGTANAMGIVFAKPAAVATGE